MILFRLTLSTIKVRKTWVIVFLLALILPFVLPQLTPWEANVKLIPPARAQTAWGLTWVLGVLWTLSQAARFGDGNSRTGIGHYLKSRGFSPSRQMFSIWGSIMLCLLPLVACAVLVCDLFARPGNPEEASRWIVTNFQYAALYLLTIAPLALLAIALGSRFGAMVGYVVPAALCLYGLYGVGYLGMTIRMNSNPVLEWLYVVSPQYHLADLTPRLILKMGDMPSGDFMSVTLYFVGLALLLGGASAALFRTEPLRS